ncbi:hypothetical protein DPMN_020065 [Dreissena polymorpha]|uniref:Uncharacterized protein n=1 Tax=Dreissena polymorpha TaxID=45954 RepID=A0A9D4NJP5_DREPO|nr:hypothetical protein DPMN_020065 [Dreissena polymorpha]
MKSSTVTCSWFRVSQNHPVPCDENLQRDCDLALYIPNGQVDDHLGLDSHCSKNV